MKKWVEQKHSSARKRQNETYFRQMDWDDPSPDGRPRKFEYPMAMMRNKDASVQEDGYHWLLGYAAEFLDDLMREFYAEPDDGLKLWLLRKQVSYSARTHVRSMCWLNNYNHRTNPCGRRPFGALKEMDTREARKVLWEDGTSP